MTTRRRRHLTAGYLALQGVACLAWWLGLALWPAFRAHFVVPEWSEQTLLVFWLPDLAVWVLGSLVAALAVLTRHPRAATALGLAAGGVLYATLYSLALVWHTGSGGLGLALMAPAALVTTGLALAAPRLLR